MTTHVSYDLFFSRRNGHAFLAVSTVVLNSKLKVVHSHNATLTGEYDWERREMLNEFRRFRAEKADSSEEYYKEHEDFKCITIRKTWEG